MSLFWHKYLFAWATCLAPAWKLHFVGWGQIGYSVNRKENYFRYVDKSFFFNQKNTFTIWIQIHLVGWGEGVTNWVCQPHQKRPRRQLWTLLKQKTPIPLPPLSLSLYCNHNFSPFAEIKFWKALCTRQFLARLGATDHNFTPCLPLSARKWVDHSFRLAWLRGFQACFIFYGILYFIDRFCLMNCF